jgi:hypothetical protein
MKRRLARRGITLVELMAGVMVLGLTVVSAVAMFPLSAFLRERSGSYSRAAGIVQRKLEQIRQLPAERIHYSGLRTAGIVDEEESPSTAGSFSFTSTDQLETQLDEAQGAIRLTGVGTDMVEAHVVLTWEGTRKIQNQIEATTFVASKEIWREP